MTKGFDGAPGGVVGACGIAAGIGAPAKADANGIFHVDDIGDLIPGVGEKLHRGGIGCQPERAMLCPEAICHAAGARST